MQESLVPPSGELSLFGLAQLEGLWQLHDALPCVVFRPAGGAGAAAKMPAPAAGRETSGFPDSCPYREKSAGVVATRPASACGTIKGMSGEHPYLPPDELEARQTESGLTEILGFSLVVVVGVIGGVLAGAVTISWLIRELF